MRKSRSSFLHFFSTHVHLCLCGLRQPQRVQTNQLVTIRFKPEKTALNQFDICGMFERNTLLCRRTYSTGFTASEWKRNSVAFAKLSRTYNINVCEFSPDICVHFLFQKKHRGKGLFFVSVLLLLIKKVNKIKVCFVCFKLECARILYLIQSWTLINF